jgi:hypothetical protein
LLIPIGGNHASAFSMVAVVWGSVRYEMSSLACATFLLVVGMARPPSTGA